MVLGAAWPWTCLARPADVASHDGGRQELAAPRGLPGGGGISFPPSPSHVPAFVPPLRSQPSGTRCLGRRGWEGLAEELGSPCHLSSLLSSPFPWKPTHVGPDKLSASEGPFSDVHGLSPVYLDPARWPDSVRPTGSRVVCKPCHSPQGHH